ncbi:MAG: alpha/beta hydrolase [Bacteroidota bacterium]
MKNILSWCAACILFSAARSQQVLPLYTSVIPNSKPAENLEKSETKGGVLIISRISIPTLTVYLPQPAESNGTAVIICPGGGYYVNAMANEGTDVARLLAARGVAAFVLKYRIPEERTMMNTAIGPLQDAQQAMILVRGNAKKWNINPGRIGIMGFSAGGHLASTLGTHYKKILVDNPGSVSVAPNFMILVYPLITGDSLVNKKGSLDKLLGNRAPQELVDDFSNEKQVTPATAPTFITQSTDDGLNVLNSIVFYEALVKNKVPAELHLYQNGGHGYGMNNKTTRDKWMDRCLAWMDANGWLKK